MTADRASIFGDDLPEVDAADFKPKPKKKPADKQAVRAASDAAGFPSRQPQPSPKQQRRRRTGRNQQINIKATAETVETMNAIADQQGWGLGETLEHAIAALQSQLGEG